MEKGKLIFVSGGVRSGKSSFAENLAVYWKEKTTKNLHYIACSVYSDEEMRERITRHQQNRAKSQLNWQTWECAYDLERISGYFYNHDILLLDCVTNLLNNYLFDWKMEQPLDVMSLILKDVFSLQKNAGCLIVVSNEVTQDIPYQSSLTTTYQYILGNLHQQLIQQSDQAYLVENGIHVCKKGDCTKTENGR